MSDPLSLLTGVITFLAAFKDQFKSLDQNRFELAVSEITKQITEANIEISALAQKNLDLEKENRELREDKKHPLVFDVKDGVYYGADDTDHLEPYCPHCYDAEHLRIHLRPHRYCRHCSTSYEEMSDETKRWLFGGHR
jgi:hypothetical protein